MSESIIKVEGLGKKYVIAHETRERYTALRDVISRKAKRLIKNDGVHETSKEEFWALKNINFEIEQGERVGVIGRNGAGKSTLLKVLSRITEPTTGRIEINGRVASLLEVGTGFHPELTGRENIFLNGAILGMTRAEIRTKFDEIVDFSGVEQFLDTPVKRYSSGMSVRLAFAVAAHLEPEILIVDEVLAVGDADFQKKCLGKMDEVSRKEGRTVLFVSHQMGAIQNLCSKTIVLSRGEIFKISSSAEAISTYLSLNQSESAGNNFLAERKDRKGTGKLKFTRVIVKDAETHEELTEVMGGKNIYFRIFFEKQEQKPYRSFHVAVGLYDQFGSVLSNINTDLTKYDIEILPPESNYIDLCIEAFPLNTGMYSLTLFAKVDGDIADWVSNAFDFNVTTGDFFKTGRTFDKVHGVMFINHQFRLG